MICLILIRILVRQANAHNAAVKVLMLKSTRKELKGVNMAIVDISKVLILSMKIYKKIKCRILILLKISFRKMNCVVKKKANARLYRFSSLLKLRTSKGIKAKKEITKMLILG